MTSQGQFLLFIASDRREAEPWVRHWNDLERLALPVHWARKGKWKGRPAMAIANGVGPDRAAAAVHAAETTSAHFAAVVSIGTAGALDPSLAIADIVVASAVTDGKVTWPAHDPVGPPSRSGLVHSSPHIAGTVGKKRKLNQSGAIIVEMEAAGVAREAEKLAVPFYCVRVVSDRAEESFFLDFERVIMPDGKFNIPRLVMLALANPAKGFGELLRLQKRTALGARRLAAYLNQCEF